MIGLTTCMLDRVFFPDPIRSKVSISTDGWLSLLPSDSNHWLSSWDTSTHFATQKRICRTDRLQILPWRVLQWRGNSEMYPLNKFTLDQVRQMTEIEAESHLSNSTSFKDSLPAFIAVEKNIKELLEKTPHLLSRLRLGQVWKKIHVFFLDTRPSCCPHCQNIPSVNEPTRFVFPTKW